MQAVKPRDRHLVDFISPETRIAMSGEFDKKYLRWHFHRRNVYLGTKRPFGAQFNWVSCTVALSKESVGGKSSHQNAKGALFISIRLLAQSTGVQINKGWVHTCQYPLQERSTPGDRVRDEFRENAKPGCGACVTMTQEP